jgi:radical SAM superfamily enzyme YgiQ (UPF0313 family)
MMGDPKFVLVFPKFPGIEIFGIQIVNQEYSDPLGILHLGTYLQCKNVEIVLINCITDENWKEKLLHEVKNADLVGISSMTEQLPHALEIAKLVKEAQPELPLVMGGAHATLYPAQCVNHPLVDFAIIGEGELSTSDLIEAIITNGDISEIDGIAYKNGDKVIINEKSRNFDFKTLPKIDYRLFGENVFKNLHKYSVGVLTSRGCPHGCTFCINSIIKEKRIWKHWDPHRVIEEIEGLLELGVRDIAFWDENFFVNKDRVEKILSMIEEKGLKFTWFANIRADYFKEDFINEKFLKRLEKSGLRRIGIGAESGSQKILDYLNKRTTPDHYINVAKMCSGTEIVPYFSFMIGLPNEDKNDIQQTLGLISRIQENCPQAKFAGPQLYRPYPGSRLFNDCVDMGWNPPKTLEEWADNVSTNTLQTDPFQMPWVLNPSFTRTAWFYSLFLVLDYKKSIFHFLDYCKNNKHGLKIKIPGSIAIIIISTLGKFRYKTGFNRFPIEISLLRKFRTALSA